MEGIWEERLEPRRARTDDARTAYEVDYARVLHSHSFRRLSGKTQVISAGNGDHQRTRLTHSLEVAQIARGISQRFRLVDDLPDVLRTHLADTSLIEVIGMTHDLGHPPHGHGGEEALNCVMRDHGGFEGNGQTLRILARLEDFSEAAGANLTRRTLLGTLKYAKPYSQAIRRPVPGPYITPGGVPMIMERLHAPVKSHLDTETPIVAWLLAHLAPDERRRVVDGNVKTVDCQLMDVADDLAYSIADMQDAIALGLLPRDHLVADVPAPLWDDFIAHSRQAGSSDLYSDASGFETVVDALYAGRRSLQGQTSALMGWGIARARVVERPEFSDPLYATGIALAPEARKFVEALKRCIMERVILSHRVQHGRAMGQRQILSVMDVLMADPRHHLPEGRYRAYREAGDDPRIACDWVAGMTEGYLERIYRRMFTPGAAPVADGS